MADEPALAAAFYFAIAWASHSSLVTAAIVYSPHAMPDRASIDREHVLAASELRASRVEAALDLWRSRHEVWADPRLSRPGGAVRLW